MYADQLELIMKGDVIGAANLESESLNSLFDSSEERTNIHSPNRASTLKNSENHVWTSLQYAKANLVLSRFMREKSKKCKNCEKRNPKLTSPTFGWLKMVCSPLPFFTVISIDFEFSIFSP